MRIADTANAWKRDAGVVVLPPSDGYDQALKEDPAQAGLFDREISRPVWQTSLQKYNMMREITTTQIINFLPTRLAGGATPDERVPGIVGRSAPIETHLLRL